MFEHKAHSHKRQIWIILEEFVYFYHAAHIHHSVSRTHIRCAHTLCVCSAQC